jgi:tyrosyl-tRNA synthetase
MFLGEKKRKIITEREAIEEVLTRGVDKLVNEEVLRGALSEGQPLRIKLGIDPTSPHIHIGRAVVLRKLKAFQDLGHTPVFIVGDFTGVIGDTSDKDAERPMLTPEKIKENLKSYFAQAGKIIDLKKAETHYNSTWLSKLTYKEIGQQADWVSVADFISRDVIKRRLDQGSRVSLREMLYPLMQGYDSVAVKADVELGGVDQWFNLLSGRVMQEHYKQKPQNILTTKLLMGLDGRKMSSSWGNTINITETPNEMFGKTMSLKDELLSEYFTLATDLKDDFIKEALLKGPRDAKVILARTLVAQYHGEKEAEKAEHYFIETFSQKKIPDEVKEIKIKDGELLGDVLLREGIIGSKSELSRLILQNAVTLLPEVKIGTINAPAIKGKTYKIGKHRFVKII